MLSFLPQLVVSGIATGMLYALVALSMTVGYRATTVVNFGQGDMLMSVNTPQSVRVTSGDDYGRRLEEATQDGRITNKAIQLRPRTITRCSRARPPSSSAVSRGSGIALVIGSVIPHP